MLEASVVDEIRGVLAERDLDRKLKLARSLCRESARIGGASGVGPALGSLESGGTVPGRPPSWSVLPARALPDRPRLGSARGRYQLLHSVAHIELSAVELALMSVADFPGQHIQYYRDMLRVAREEIVHTQMLRRRLRKLGGELGTEPVHLGLWETAAEHGDLAERLAVVPRILEARGLDVSGRLRTQLVRAGDAESADILERIYRDEIDHVRVGTRWYREVCRSRGLDPEAHFVGMVQRFRPRRGGVTLDREGRRRAGFTDRELDALDGG